VPQFANVEGFVLAGGRSSRMGRDKALLEIGGQALLAGAVELLRSIALRVSIIGDRESYRNFGVPTIPDSVPDSGPVSGLATALAHSKSDWALVIGCDMPRITRQLLEFLCERAQRASGETQAIVPESPLGLEPLCAVYHITSAATFEAALAAKKLKLTDAVSQLCLNRIGEKDWRAFSPDESLFQSVNTLEQFEATRRAFEK
jgi:molybdopterin-guanine dinucleotide biosynthesis protein A